jgi:hypothetical protein
MYKVGSTCIFQTTLLALSNVINGRATRICKYTLEGFARGEGVPCWIGGISTDLGTVQTNTHTAAAAAAEVDVSNINRVY